MARHTKGPVRVGRVRTEALCCAMLGALTLGACGGSDDGTADEALREAEHKRLDGSIHPHLDASTPEPDAGGDVDAGIDVDAGDTDGGTDAGSADGGAPGRDPNAAYVAEVVANGTGCPKGTWRAQVAPDGTRVVVNFDAYEAEVDPTLSVDVADCLLALKVQSPADRSFALTAAAFGGYAYLEPGVTARATVQYYFQGDPVNGAAGRTALSGPYDDEIVFEDQVAAGDAVWSPCGKVRDLNVATRIVVENGQPKATGYLSFDRVIELQLATRACP